MVMMSSILFVKYPSVSILLIICNCQIKEVISASLSFSMFEPKKWDKDSELQRERTRALLKTMSFSHIGSYESYASCPNHGPSFFSGARVRLSEELNQTHPMVAAIEFLCSDGIQQSIKGEGTLLMQKNVGNWTEMRECPNGGFVTGITVFMQSVSTGSLIADEAIESFTQNNQQEQSHFFDVFELGRTRYISGISLNCSYSREYDENVVDGFVENGDSTVPVLPSWRNTVTIGRPSGMGLRLYCSEDRVVSGISVEQEALITYEDGERWLPLDITTRCSLLTNPVKHCYPELDWEGIHDMTCRDIKTGKNAFKPKNQTGYANVICKVPHFVGLSPNQDIENLDKILRTYEPMHLDGVETRIFLRAKLFSPLFQREWLRKYKLNMTDYRMAILRRHVDTYLDMKEEIYLANFTNVSYAEPEYSKQIRNNAHEPLKYEFSVKQLVGYCSIYKIYFPVFKTQFQTYFERTIDKIKSRMIFPQVNDNDNAYLADIIESKLGFKL